MLEPTPGPISICEFQKLIAASDVKLELIEGEVLAFAGGSIAHGILCTRVLAILAGAANTGCQVFGSDVALRLAASETYVFPDASYTCEPLDPSATAIGAPSLIVEIISPESVRRDRVEKLEAYQSLPSVQEYLLVDSRRIWVAVYRRFTEMWTETTYRGLEDVVELHSADVHTSVAQLYSGTGRILQP